MKSRIVIDLGVFNSILRELRAMRRELKIIKGEEEKKPLPKRELKDPIRTPDVLNILKVTPSTLNSYEKKGFIKFHKEGQAKIYSEAEVREFKSTKGRRKRITKSLISRKFAPKTGARRRGRPRKNEG